MAKTKKEVIEKSIKLQSSMMNTKIKKQLEAYEISACDSEVVVLSFSEYSLREVNKLLKRLSEPQLLLN